MNDKFENIRPYYNHEAIEAIRKLFNNQDFIESLSFLKEQTTTLGAKNIPLGLDHIDYNHVVVVDNIKDGADSGNRTRTLNVED